MTKIVCFDTNIFSYVFRVSRDKNEEKIKQADFLLENIKNDKSIIAIPTIVLGELAYFIDDSKIQSFFEAIQKFYIIFPYDQTSACFYRKIARERRDVQTENPRWSKSADLKIISTALAHGASCLYSEDQGMATLAQGFLPVHPLPQLPPQQRHLPITSQVQ